MLNCQNITNLLQFFNNLGAEMLNDQNEFSCNVNRNDSPKLINFI